MGCVEKLNYEVLIRHCSFREAAEYIRKNTPEYYEVPPGFRIFDVHIIGVPPILVGVEGEHIIFPYTKPCHGTFLLRVVGGEEIESLRKRGKRVR
ncbi:MAG TPA: DUF1894 domain-containing protein [Methanoculleus sp.]|mgnify:CR=1 FL=1|nr:DUF1894 domain-containing protein [Methanoculleus sp.]